MKGVPSIKYQRHLAKQREGRTKALTPEQKAKVEFNKRRAAENRAALLAVEDRRGEA